MSESPSMTQGLHPSLFAEPASFSENEWGLTRLLALRTLVGLGERYPAWIYSWPQGTQLGEPGDTRGTVPEAHFQTSVFSVVTDCSVVCLSPYSHDAPCLGSFLMPPSGCPTSGLLHSAAHVLATSCLLFLLPPSRALASGTPTSTTQSWTPLPYNCYRGRDLPCWRQERLWNMPPSS